ncbi:MAG: hypothetical protein HRT69_05855 [Flavobacteriaceae bacterium]|nr:hypothetical protein [Flavobacteriaceae bacterium]
MKKLFLILIAFLTLSCLSNPDSSKKDDLTIHTELKSIEIEYTESREKIIEQLIEVWNCKSLSIASSETNWNGKISNSITILINETNKVNLKKREERIKSTSELIKKTISNYKEFHEVKILYSYTTEDGEKVNSSVTVQTKDL